MKGARWVWLQAMRMFSAGRPPAAASAARRARRLLGSEGDEIEADDRDAVLTGLGEEDAALQRPHHPLGTGHVGHAEHPHARLRRDVYLGTTDAQER